MPLLNVLSRKYPLTTASFVKWLTARDLLKPYGRYLRVPLNKLPVEMIYGVMLLFFHEQGVAITVKVSTAGRLRSTIYIRRLTGVYGLKYRGPYERTAEEAQRTSIVSAFSMMERRMKAALPKDAPDGEEQLIIGLDVERILRESDERNLLPA